MPRKHKQLAKLARPVADGLVERPRLFQALDRACRQTTVWVMAPAGSGKTCLVTSYLESRKRPCLWYQIDKGDADPATFFLYLGQAVQTLTPRKRPLPLLTPEYLPNLEVYVRRFFRLMFERLPSTLMLVLDNYHEAPDDSALHGVLAVALNEIPPEQTVIFISRYEPPAPLARRFAHASLIGWEGLKLTRQEAAAFLTRHGHSDLARLQPCIEAAQGWAAGLVLLARAQADTVTGLPSTIAQPQLLYDYFEQEVLNRIPAASHDCLLKAALFPLVTPSIVQKMTGVRQAAAIFAALHRERYFIDRHSGTAEVYTYHPLFQDFLLKRGQQCYPEPELLKIKHQAASILEENGQIDAAMELLLATEHWKDCARLMQLHAPQWLEQGRNALLESWLSRLPASERDQDPWLLYWAGLCRMPLSPPEGRIKLEAAFNRFKADDDAAGLFLSLGAVLSTFYFEWGDFSPVKDWLTELESLQERYSQYPSVGWNQEWLWV